ncbi:hypothetical protein [Novosphingobium sp. MBES04]|uniref:hypothetical protein n=1 Tax=Novosphingobium sp. MBES04 TaxID=1206458 RepID=UPI000A6D2FCD|nr:hypothetical protein [Novosphingobium sp. MBES04]
MTHAAFGPTCPGCTSARITAQIERNPDAMPLCQACRDRGALFHAERRPSSTSDEGSHGQG